MYILRIMVTGCYPSILVLIIANSKNIMSRTENTARGVVGQCKK